MGMVMDYEFPYNDYGENESDDLFVPIDTPQSPQVIEAYQFVSGPFDGGWCSRCSLGIVIANEVIKTIVSADGEAIHLEGNMYMPGEIRIRFGGKHANYGCLDSRDRKYVFKGYV